MKSTAVRRQLSWRAESNDKTAYPGTTSFRNGCLRNKYDPFPQRERTHNLRSEEK